MNTGERLTSLSGLSLRSAFDHFMAITAGSGPGKTIFASQMTVCSETPETVVVQRAQSPITEVERKSSSEVSNKEQRSWAKTETSRSTARLVTEASYVVQHSTTSTTTIRARRGKFTA